VEHHLAWQNAQPGHALVVCAPNKTAEQNKKNRQKRLFSALVVVDK